MNQMVKDYSEFNHWANKRIANWLSKIPMETIKSKKKSSYDSVYSTIHHILTSEKFWLSRITESKFEPPQRSEETSIFQEYENQSKVFNETIQSIGNDDLEKEIEVNLKIIGLNLEGKCSIAALVQHCVNHSTYHRGQIVTIARNLGIEDKIPSTDFFYYKMIKQMDSNKISK